MRRCGPITAVLALVLAGCHRSPPAAAPADAGGPVDIEFPSPAGGPGVPKLPKLGAIQVSVDGDRLTVNFLPVAGAKDYRVFPLPNGQDVSVDPTGFVAIKDATYRCAGDRFAERAVLDGSPSSTNGWTTTIVNGSIEGFSRKAADATLGHVYADAAAGRVPVYALGGPAASADNTCGGEIWKASRVKRYTTSDTTRAQLLAAGWRDDGIVFYAPSTGDVTVRTASSGNSKALYFVGAETTARASLSPTPAFTIHSTQLDGTVPLMRVHYKGGCSDSHDELVPGQGWFERITTQGNQPLFEVQWPGLAAETTFVVEALDKGCPFQGHLSPTHVAAGGEAQTFVTIAEVRAGSPTREVFVNGQHDPSNRPRAIARAFVKVSPTTPPAMDWTARFPTNQPGPIFTEVKRADHTYIDLYLTSTDLDVQYYSLEPTIYSLGAVLGELWTTYADWAADTPGKFRMTAKQKATLAAGSYVHATMTTDIWSTGRRYPQLMISDQPSPLQENFAGGTTLIVQSRGPWPFALELQICDHRTWDVNNQCPRFRIEQAGNSPWPAHAMAGEFAAPMQLKKIDLYASTSKAYVLFDGKPYGCANLTAAPAAGPVTVTFGDVLYHSGVDEPVLAGRYRFLQDHQLTETRRHFANLGFSSGASLPAWDASVYPCTSTLDN